MGLKRTTVLIPEELYILVHERAIVENTTVSEQIRRALEYYLSATKPKPRECKVKKRLEELERLVEELRETVEELDRRVSALEERLGI